jgi:hypothetical protein
MTPEPQPAPERPIEAPPIGTTLEEYYRRYPDHRNPAPYGN